MSTAHRRQALALVLLLVTAALWILAALFKLSVTEFFHAFLIKRLGMIPVLGIMFVAPILAALIGILECRRNQSQRVGVLLIGDGSYHVSVHHCLLAHNDFRNPLISSGGTHDIVNNVIYDWGVLPAEIVDPDANTFLNFVGNCFRPGPSSRTDCFEILINPSHKYGTAKPKFFVRDNLSPHRSTTEESDWSLVGYGFSDREPAPEELRAFDAFQAHPVSATDARNAFDQVLAGAGATLPRRDAVDERIVQEVRSNGGRIIDSPNDVGGYPRLASETSTRKYRPVARPRPDPCHRLVFGVYLRASKVASVIQEIPKP